MGLLQELGVRQCRVSGHTCTVWEVTDRVSPLALPQRVSQRERADKFRRVLEGVAKYFKVNGMGLEARTIAFRIAEIENNGKKIGK